MKSSDKLSSIKCLPVALATPDGNVDPQRLLSLVAGKLLRPARLIRRLVDRLKTKDFRKADDPFDRLAACLSDPAFRRDWYERSRDLEIPPLFRLIEIWAVMAFPALDRDSHELAEFWRHDKSIHRERRDYPKLESIAVLGEVLATVATEAPDTAALYCWALMESARWHALYDPTETSLSGLEAALTDELNRRKLDGVLQLLAPLSVPHQRNANDSPGDTSVAFTPTEGNPVVEPIDDEVKVISSDDTISIAIEESISKCAEAIASVAEKRTELTTALAHLDRAPNPSAVVTTGLTLLSSINNELS